ncbi:MAG: imidazole glycerol phosphate synthase subunit HisF [Pseudomonadota bacterium]
MLARRIIPCLDVRDGKVVKGVRFRNHEVVGEIEELARRYAETGADELVFYDITASPEERVVEPDWVSRVARAIDIPFCVAGGVRSVDAARARLFAGADKISVNTPALNDPALIDRLSAEFGAQCIVLGVDSRVIDDDWRVHQNTGDPNKTSASHRRTLDWIGEAIDRGVGEVVLNCMDQDGVREGYDVDQLSAARQVCTVPLIASGGAGAVGHFTEVFHRADVDGALAASVFHKGLIEIPDLKAALKAAEIEVRL